MIRQAIGNYVFDGNKIQKNCIVKYDENGTIISLSPWDGTELANTVHYSGLIVPGFVNAHCHLELSHLYKKIEAQNGMAAFVRGVVSQRKADLSAIETAARAADAMMFRNGIVAVGDIANTTDTRSVKIASKLHYHTFVETFGLHPKDAQHLHQTAGTIREQFKPLLATITPHAPYSVSNQLFELINKTNEQNTILSIHNQESIDEELLFSKAEGQLYNQFKNLGFPLNEKAGTAHSALQHLVPLLPHKGSVILIHNVLTSTVDLDFLHQHRPDLDVSFCLCPLSNKYITNATPPIDMLLERGEKICIGTDSLASNTELSILAEMLELQKQSSKIKLEDLLKCASINGAEALRFDKTLGSISRDKTPGLLQLWPFDIQNFKLLPETKVKRII